MVSSTSWQSMRLAPTFPAHAAIPSCLRIFFNSLSATRASVSISSSSSTLMQLLRAPRFTPPWPFPYHASLSAAPDFPTPENAVP